VDEPLANQTDSQEPPDFSLILGGPLFQLWRRTRLAGNALELLHRRIVVIVTLAWLPLLLLSAAEGHGWSTGVKLPFLYDIEMHVRLLVALPLLIVAEVVVHQRMRLVVRQFLSRGLVPDAARAKFDAAIEAAMRLRNSITAEVALIVFVYVVGMGFVWRTQVALDVSSWYGISAGGKWQPTLAGWWMVGVSLPIFQFILFRWYFRMFIWARFLWQVSSLELRFIPTHPDRCGGAGFLSSVSEAFVPVLLAQGALLAGLMADKIFYAGAKLPDFKLEVGGIVVVMLFAVLGPLLAFLPRLAAVKRAGLQEYGALSQRYVREFDEKWLRGGAPANEPLLGSYDIGSLANIADSYAVVMSMQLVPFTPKTAARLAITTLLPVAPLLLTVMPMEELIQRLIKLVV